MHVCVCSCGCVCVFEHVSMCMCACVSVCAFVCVCAVFNSNEQQTFLLPGGLKGFVFFFSFSGRRSDGFDLSVYDWSDTHPSVKLHLRLSLCQLKLQE